MKRRSLFLALVLPFTQQVFAGQDLSQAANDPTAPLMNMQVNDRYTSSYHNVEDESGNQIQLRGALPFKWGDTQHIMRVTVPIITESPFIDNGISDTTVFDLATFTSSWGRWGAGVVGLLPTGGKNRGAEKWGIGPAIGFVVSSDALIWGAFNQNIFTVAGEDDRDDVNLSIVQPIINYSLPNGWSLGSSDMSITYDWENNEFSNLPLGIKLSKLHRFGKTPVQFGLEYEYNVADDSPAAPKSSIQLSTKILFPGRH